MNRFMKGMVAIATAMSLAGCATGNNTSAVSGEFTGTAKGMGDITVTVTLEDSVITNVTADGPDETPDIGGKALEMLTEEMTEGKTINVDSISGATVTSEALVEGARAALESAGVNPDDYMTAVEAGEAEDVTMDADVVVIGAGGAGMTAAIVAADAGKDVVILESQAMAGGNSVRSTGGMNASKTKYQDENEFAEESGVEKTLETAKNDYADNETITALAATVQEQWDAYQANPEGYFDSVELMELDTTIGGKGINNPELVATLAENSADAIDWLSSIGAELTSVGAFGGASVKRIHRPVNEEGQTISVGSYVVPILEKTVEDRGVEIVYEATANEILMEDGKAAGVVAEGAAGNTITVNASAVIIATGGFGANNDMVKEQNASLDGYVTTNAPGALGQGITMATAEGIDAATVDMDQIQLHPTVHVEGSNAALITEGLRGDGAILVNQEGKRFTDEVGTRDAVSAAENEQTGGYAWLIVDQAMVDASAVIQGYIDKGYALEGETYEELAEAMETDAAAFAETMETWNAAVEAKSDPEFNRTSFAEPLNTAPYYAIKVQPGIHHTMGGLVINTAAEVLNTSDEVIPGLFAAGEVTGGIHGNNRLGGNAVADFIVFGRIAGQSAADYVG